MKKTQLTRYASLRRREVEAGAKAEKIYDDSAWSERRVNRLNKLDSRRLASYGQNLLEEQKAILKALLDEPTDGSIFKPVHGATSTGNVENYAMLSRDIDVPRIGGLVLESEVPSDLRAKLGENQTYGLYFRVDPEIDEEVLAEDLQIAGVSRATEQPRSTPFDNRTGRHQRNTVYPNAQLGGERPDAVEDTAQLEDSVETLRVICDAAGIEVEPVATIPEASAAPN